jgi:hypothetical protein
MTEFLSRAQVHPNPSRHGGYYLGVQRQPYLVQHHTPGQEPTTYDEAIEEYNQIYWGHVGNGWNDFGYNFLIWDRFIMEGRGFGWTGAHAPGANSISLGVAFILDGRNRIPTPTEYQAFHDLADAADTYGYLQKKFELTGHRDWVSTSCPGDLCYAHLDDFWLHEDQQPLPFPSSTKEKSMYEFNLRPGGAVKTDASGWNLNHIKYPGGAAAYDFHDVKVGDRIVISATNPGVTDFAVNVFYPSAKQTEAKAVRFGKPVQWSAEEAGFVTVLAENWASGHIRITGERKD